jgi:phenylacetate-CoA ligase
MSTAGRGGPRYLSTAARVLARASRPRIERFRDAQLRRVVTRAYARVPRYRRLFDDAGVRPEDVRTAADLQRLPITTRAEAQTTPLQDQVARGVDPGRLVTRLTSGAAGAPLSVRRTWMEEQVRALFRVRAWRAWGVRLRDRRVGVTLVRRPDPHGHPGLHRFLAWVGLENKRLLDLGLGPAGILAALQRERPDVLVAFASVLARVARLATDEDRARLALRVIISGGEVLTSTARADIERGLGAPVRDWYGAHELGMIGWECPRTGAFHVAEDGVALEVLRGGRPAAVGEAGEAVGTNLHAFAMPFIRYRVGDMVTRGPCPCPCGAPWATLLGVEGRTRDWFPLANGRVLHPWVLHAPITRDALGWLAEFQLVQERPDRVVLDAVARRAPAPEELARVRETSAIHLGPGIEFEVRLVSAIEPGPGGKFHFARSLVERPS